jgi:hypothetical protein
MFFGDAFRQGEFHTAICGSRLMRRSERYRAVTSDK